jgi:hypothetical protein
MPRPSISSENITYHLLTSDQSNPRSSLWGSVVWRAQRARANRPVQAGFLLAVALSCALTITVCAAKDELANNMPSSGNSLAFNIPSQPLAAALQAFGQQTGIQVLYESGSAAGFTSVAVVGTFDPEAALLLLLSGTDLKMRFSGERAITIALPSAGGNGPPAQVVGTDISLGTMRVRSSQETRQRNGLAEFSQGIQSDIETALQRNVATRSGNYRFTIGLWLDAAHAVRRAEMLQSTGQHDRDAAVLATLQGLVVSRQAPENTPQPVRVVVVVRSPQ